MRSPAIYTTNVNQVMLTIPFCINLQTQLNGIPNIPACIYCSQGFRGFTFDSNHSLLFNLFKSLFCVPLFENALNYFIIMFFGNMSTTYGKNF